MTDLYNRNVEFSLSPLMKMGISPFEHELQQNDTKRMYGGLSNLYFPGGLFVTDYLQHLREEEETEDEKDPSKIKVTENFDVFIDLVNVPKQESNSKKSNKIDKPKSKTKKNLSKN